MVDYSKWNNIEISDDEDEIHPNIHAQSHKHPAHIERMKTYNKEMELLEKRRAEHEKKYSETKKRLSEDNTNATDLPEVQQALKELEKEKEEIKKLADDLKKKEEKTPWNIDTICKPGFTRTLINIKPMMEDQDLMEERIRQFLREHINELEHYGNLHRYVDSWEYLKTHDFLVCAEAGICLILLCLRMKNREDCLMEHLAHQAICIKCILELAKQEHCSIKAASDMFFTMIQIESPAKALFNNEVRQFKGLIVRVSELKQALMKYEDNQTQSSSDKKAGNEDDDK